MTHDYGRRAKHRTGGGAKVALIVGGVIAVGLAAAVVGAGMVSGQARDKADQATYGVSGPPCPTTTVAELAAKGPALKHNFEYDDLQLSHAFGMADCAEINGKGGFMGIGAPKIAICRFSGPGSLEVKDGATDQLFLTGIGKPAAILRENGQVKCVMAARALG